MLKYKNFYIYSFVIICGYFLTRLKNLTIVPVFCDEAIYIRWAQVMRAVPSLRFLPLSDGKQPLFMWLVIPFLKVFPNPLIAGRMVSIFAGLGTMIGIFVLSLLFFKNKIASFFAALFYLTTPFFLFFDRMALVDGLLSFFGVWFFVFSLLLVQTLRLDAAMIAGILLGLGLITKSPALFFALMLPFTLLFFRRSNGIMKPSFTKVSAGRPWNKLFELVGLWMVVIIFGYSIYNILRLGPEFHMIAIRNKDYVFSFQEVIKHPLNPFLSNLKNVFNWYWILLTPLVFVLGITGIFLALKKDFKQSVLLLIWWLVPILAQSAIAKVYTARYILFSVPFFLIFGAFCLSFFWRSVFWRSDLKGGRTSLVLLLLVIFVLPLYQDFLLLIDPQKAWLPANEKSGYLEQWTAGYGIKEVAEYLKNVAKTQKVLVGTEGYFGTLPNGLEMYLEKVPNITIIGVGQPIREISPKLLDGLKDNRVFLLVNDTRLLLTDRSRLREIAFYPKAIDRKTVIPERLLFFEIIDEI